MAKKSSSLPGAIPAASVTISEIRPTALVGETQLRLSSAAGSFQPQLYLDSLPFQISSVPVGSGLPTLGSGEIWVGDGGVPVAVAPTGSDGVDVQPTAGALNVALSAIGALEVLYNPGPGPLPPVGTPLSGLIGDSGGGFRFGNSPTTAPDVPIYLGVSTANTSQALVDGALVKVATSVSSLVANYHSPLSAGRTVQMRLFVSTDKGLTYSAVPGATALFSSSPDTKSISFTPYMLPALSMICIEVITAGFASTGFPFSALVGAA